MNKTRRYSPEVRERAIRMGGEREHRHDSQWAAIRSIAAKIGCSAETLRKWVRQAERDTGRRPGLTSEVPPKTGPAGLSFRSERSVRPESP